MLDHFHDHSFKASLKVQTRSGLPSPPYSTTVCLSSVVSFPLSLQLHILDLTLVFQFLKQHILFISQTSYLPNPPSPHTPPGSFLYLEQLSLHLANSHSILGNNWPLDLIRSPLLCSPTAPGISPTIPAVRFNYVIKSIFPNRL